MKFDKSKLPSRHVTEGPERAPHRSYYYAMGLTDEEIHRPFVGVASCWNEAAPCNIALMRQAQATKKGVKEGGGTPREFCTITVNGARGHEVLARLARSDRGLRRVDGARPLL
jgi:dihydroxy-acid dehydratase